MPAALTRPTAFNFGEHYIKRRDIRMILTNNTTRNVTVTFFTFCNFLHVSLYEEWFKVLVDAMLECLNKCVIARGGRPF